MWDWHRPCTHLPLGVSPKIQGRFKTGDLEQIPREFFSHTANFRHSIGLKLGTKWITI
jgi:hypothetical protein